MQDLNRDDLLAAIEAAPEVSGSLQPDENGYQHFIPASEEQRAAVEKFVSEELEAAIKDSEPVWAKMLRNRRAYLALSDKDELLTIPLCKRDGLQRIAWMYNTITKKHPMISVSPDEPGSVQVIIHDEETQQPKVISLTTEDEAKGLEDLLQFKFSKRIPFKKILATTLTDMISGQAPTYWKVCWHRDEKTIRQRNVENGQLVIEDKRVPYGEGARIYNVSGYNVAMCGDALDPEEAPLVGERQPLSATDLRARISSSEFNLAASLQQEDREALLAARTTNLSGSTPNGELADLSGRIANDPRGMHDTWEVWFYYPVVLPGEQVIDPYTGEASEGEPTVEILSLCGVFHRKAKRLLSCYVNPYWHGRRPYFPFFQRQATHQFVAESTVEDVAPFQRLASSIFHTKVANARQANLKAILCRANSATWRHLVTQQNKLMPGAVIPFDDPGDVVPFQLGANFNGLDAELGIVMNEGSRMSGVTDNDRNMENLTRTSTSSLAFANEQGKMQPSMDLDLFRDEAAKAITAYVQVLQQFSPYGEAIPFEDEKTKAAITKVIHFPREAITSQYGFTITASAEDQSDEVQLQQDMTLAQMIEADNQSAAQLLSLIFAPGTPPPVQQLYSTMLARKQRALGNVILRTRKDTAQYVLDPQMVSSILEQLQTMLTQAQAQGGAPDAQTQQPQLPSPGPGADVPAPDDGAGELAPPGVEPGF